MLEFNPEDEARFPHEEVTEAIRLNINVSFSESVFHLCSSVAEGACGVTAPGKSLSQQPTNAAALFRGQRH
jgi:hypothetical protein